MENTVYSDELQHHGTKGMRWGIRRYQNKDGSLTPAGQKRYNKEVEKLKKETEKVKAAEKVAAERKKTQSKFDKLEEKKQKLEERKKALKGEKDDTPDDIATAAKKKGKTPEEEIAERREKLLKSSDPKELYEGKDLLTYQELNDRINRIDLENRLQSKIPKEETKEQKTAAEWMDSVTKTVNSASALYKSVDSAYSSFANSGIAKALGLELPTGKEKPEKFNVDDFMRKLRNNDLTMDQIQNGTNALKNINTSEQQKRQLDKMMDDLGTDTNKKKDSNKSDQGGKKDKKNKSKQSETDDTPKEETKPKAESKPKEETKPKEESKPKEETKSEKSAPTRLDDDGTSRLYDDDYHRDTIERYTPGVAATYKSYMRDIADDSSKYTSLVNKTLEKTSKKDVKYVDREKDGDGYKYTYDTDDAVKRAQKAAENLAKAAQSQSKEVDRATKTGDDYIQQMFNKNKKKLDDAGY